MASHFISLPDCHYKKLSAMSSVSQICSIFVRRMTWTLLFDLYCPPSRQFILASPQLNSVLLSNESTFLPQATPDPTSTPSTNKMSWVSIFTSWNNQLLIQPVLDRRSSPWQEQHGLIRLHTCRTNDDGQWQQDPTIHLRFYGRIRCLSTLPQFRSWPPSRFARSFVLSCEFSIKKEKGGKKKSVRN